MSHLLLDYAKKWKDLALRFWKDDELAWAVWNARKNDKIDPTEVKDHQMAHIPKNVMDWIDKAIGGVS